MAGALDRTEGDVAASAGDAARGSALERPAFPFGHMLAVLELYLTFGGLISFLGYVADVQWLTDWANSGISIQPNTCVAVSCAGVALFALRRRRTRVATLAGALIGLLGAATLFEHLSAIDLGIDARLLFGRTWGRTGVTSPGRMGPAGATSWTLIGLSFVLASRPEGSPARRWVAPLALTTLGCSTLGLIGYLFGASTLYSLPRSTVIALQTATFVLSVSLGLVMSVPEHGPMRLLGATTEGAALGRRALPAVVLVPVSVGLAFIIGERAGYYDSGFGSAARTLVEILLFTLLVYWAASMVNLESSRRARAEEQRADLLEKERVARSEAERATRLKDEFLSTLSHELRTPLSAMLGWTQILKKRGGDERTLSALDVIERNGRAQAKLITDLLDISRITAGTAELDIAPVDLGAVVGSAVESILPVATAKQVRIRTDVESGLPPVNGDQARLEQIVWNLLSNAVKFTPPGGRVELALARSGAHVEIRVEDSGQGIAGEFLPHLFERFRQADGSAGRRHGGLGLGLSIVKQLAELHGGSVRATSPGVDQGAVFSVMLPIEPGSERAATARRRASLPPERARSQPPRLPGVKLLVVDDEPDALAMIRHFCEEHGARVSSAPSSSNALELVRAERFDAIVSDIAMPGGDGYELMAAIRALGIRTPAVALTAFARREDRAKALSAGFQAHVTKPVDENELVRTIAQLAAPFQASVRA